MNKFDQMNVPRFHISSSNENSETGKLQLEQNALERWGVDEWFQVRWMVSDIISQKTCASMGWQWSCMIHRAVQCTVDPNSFLRPDGQTKVFQEVLADLKRPN